MQKEAAISLLIAHHQLLMNHKEQIMADPYLRSCKLPLHFKLCVTPPLDIRLGHLLQLWAETCFVAGKPLRILEAEGACFSRDSIGSWYNPETQCIEEKQNTGNINGFIYEVRDSFHKQRLSVDLERIILQLRLPEVCSFSEQLRFAHEQFKAGMRTHNPQLAQEELKAIKLHMTAEGHVRVEVCLPNQRKPVSSPGLINHKAIYYNESVKDLMAGLYASTGFVLMEKTDWQRNLYFSRVFDPYTDDTLYAACTLIKIGSLIGSHAKGMEAINSELCTSCK